MAEESLVDDVENAIRQAAGKQSVIKIRIAIGKEVTVSRVEIAKELHKRFPQASIELDAARETDSVVVKDIEVE